MSALEQAKGHLATAMGELRAAEKLLKNAGHEGITVNTQLALGHTEQAKRKTEAVQHRAKPRGD